jgi:hypothetical protein
MKLTRFQTETLPKNATDQDRNHHPVRVVSPVSVVTPPGVPESDVGGYGQQGSENDDAKPVLGGSQREGFVNRTAGHCQQLAEAGAVSLLRP